MRLLLACCIASPLILLAPLASPHLRSAVTAPVARWAGQQVALPTPDADATPGTSGPTVVQPGSVHCGTDSSGIRFCLVVFGQAAQLFPPMFQVAATPVPPPTDTPWPGAAAMPTADTGYAPGDYGGGGP